ncbi:MAG: serine hydrolase [Alphaproteobacteria bacterium]|nr:serine hydrolase [Alphaproteobacteria bacterium]
MTLTDPAKAGFDAERLVRVQKRIAADIAAQTYDGAAIAVARGGKTVMLHADGFADRAAGRRLDLDTPIFSMSIGKQFAVAVVLNFVERGLLSLTTRVSDVIPAFGCRGKEDVQLWHLLTHTSGVITQIPPLPPEMLFNLQAFVDYICQHPAENVPGSRVNYAILAGHAVMAEMVRRVDGAKRSFRDIQREVLFDPLGMRGTFLGVPGQARSRMAPVVARDKRPGFLDPAGLEALGAAVTPEAEIPGGGYVTVVGDVLKFCEMLRGGGATDVDGHAVRILSPAMIDLASKVHTGTMPNGLMDYTINFRGWPVHPADLGLGFFLRGETLHPTPFGTMASPRTFGGLGAGSTCFFVDPERDLSYAYLSTGLMEDSYSIDRHQILADLVFSAIID